MRSSSTGSPSFLASDPMAGFMAQGRPLYVRLPSGAMAMLPPSRATRRQVFTARMSVTCFLMGMGATRYCMIRAGRPAENRSSEAT